MTRHRRALAWAAAILGVTTAPPSLLAQDPTGWNLIKPARITQTGRLGDRRLAEASGAAASITHPGVVWTLVDSGNLPVVYAIDTTGAVLATIRIPGLRNIDWEEVSLGPCAISTCLYIADTGDNREQREEVVIHRIPEPPATSETVTALLVESLRFRYPKGSHDVEAMGVFPDGSVLLVSKGRSGEVLAFELPADAWSQNQPVEARLLQILPVTPSLGTGRTVTGLAIHPDGRRVVIRTYRDLFLFDRDADGRLVPAPGSPVCDILGREPQGEAVTWLDPRRLLILSERGLFASGTVHIVECNSSNDDYGRQ